MTSSLVGSEMCIRDSDIPYPLPTMPLNMHAITSEPRHPAEIRHGPRAVSYTHLTLPTICSV
eukprot:12069714-Prorocentrum_lima.AAC.1